MSRQLPLRAGVSQPEIGRGNDQHRSMNWVPAEGSTQFNTRMISLAVTLAVRVSLAILGRCHADMANKGAAQRVRVGEAALYRHLLGRVASSLQEPPRSGDARGFHPHSRRHPNL